MELSVWLGLAGFFAANFLAASSGAVFKPGAWYDGLAKPWWNPPKWAFPVVWTILFIMISVSGWLVWRAGGWTPALGVYGAQLVINAGWSAIFFGMHRIGLAMLELLLLWASILATMVMFYPIEPIATWLLAPYLLWVTIAGCLNFSIWRLNAAPAARSSPDPGRA
ncbi:tryptophan-rich sensory protein [Roseomonas arctica]|uniref:Tryptophan-rich sensory protein n=2 Tax=Plastoroseomonas arctica TaxID=1509237 RepID=A0AAF1KHZ6_9PROT|nr:tryptophan-rich sensory protein [Plastoroseomonas arctica]